MKSAPAWVGHLAHERRWVGATGLAPAAIGVVLVALLALVATERLRARPGSKDQPNSSPNGAFRSPGGMFRSAGRIFDLEYHELATAQQFEWSTRLVLPADPHGVNLGRFRVFSGSDARRGWFVRLALHWPGGAQRNRPYLELSIVAPGTIRRGE